MTLLFDAAHAFASSYHGQMLGQFGTAEIFSFHATKFMNSFEGGAIVTNDDALSDKLRYMRNFGFAGYDNVEYVGTNGKMTEVSAAMGLTSLDSLSQFIETNYINYRCYQENLTGIPGLRMFEYDQHEKSNYQYIILEIEKHEFGVDRDTLVQILHAENILARRYFFPGCHQMEPYRSYYPHSRLLLPNTERLTACVISLPNGTSVNPQDIHSICQIIRLVSENAAEIKTRLETESTI